MHAIVSLLLLGVTPASAEFCHQQPQLDVQHLSCRGGTIDSLDGIEVFTEVRHLDLIGLKITDLTPIARLTRLEVLEIEDLAQVTSLEPLKRLPVLRRIKLKRLPGVEDLSALGQLPALIRLEIDGLPGLRSLGPLQDSSTLKQLHLRDTGLADPSSLKGLRHLSRLVLTEGAMVTLKGMPPLPALTALQVGGCGDDLGPVAILDGLVSLTIHDQAARPSLKWLAKLTHLRDLSLSLPSVQDFEPLGGLAAVERLTVYLFEGGPTDLSALRRLKRVQVAKLEIPNLKSLRGLEGYGALQGLIVESDVLHDASAVSRLFALESLSLTSPRLTRIPPVRRLKRLETLELSNTGIRALKPWLCKLKVLDGLSMAGSPITQVGLLKGCHRLQSINLNGTRVRNLRPLYGLRALQFLTVDHTKVSARQIRAFQRRRPSVELSASRMLGRCRPGMKCSRR